MSWAPAQLDDHHFTDGDGDTRNVPQLDTMGRKTDSVRTSELFTNRAVLKMTAIVSLGGLLFGFDTGVISGALPYLKDDAVMAPYATTPATLAWAQELVVSSALVAAGVGSAAGGWFADAAGRRRALLAADVLFTFGSLCMAAAQSLAALVVGRAVVGLAIGVASVTAPVFIAECAPPRVRAALVTMNVLMITGGQFLSYVSNYGFSFVPGTWRWMLGMAAVPAVAQAFGLLGLPESPKWLAGRGHAAAAKRAADLLQLPMQPMQPAQRAQQGGYGDDPEAEDGVTGRLLGGFRDDGGGVMERDGGTWAALTSRTVLRELHVGEKPCNKNKIAIIVPGSSSSSCICYVTLAGDGTFLHT